MKTLFKKNILLCWMLATALFILLNLHKNEGTSVSWNTSVWGTQLMGSVEMGEIQGVIELETRK